MPGQHSHPTLTMLGQGCYVWLGVTCYPNICVLSSKTATAAKVSNASFFVTLHVELLQNKISDKWYYNRSLSFQHLRPHLQKLSQLNATRQWRPEKTLKILCHFHFIRLAMWSHSGILTTQKLGSPPQETSVISLEEMSKWKTQICA